MWQNSIVYFSTVNYFYEIYLSIVGHLGAFSLPTLKTKDYAAISGTILHPNSDSIEVYNKDYSKTIVLDSMGHLVTLCI